jgi:hypothetical protein
LLLKIAYNKSIEMFLINNNGTQVSYYILIKNNYQFYNMEMQSQQAKSS